VAKGTPRDSFEVHRDRGSRGSRTVLSERSRAEEEARLAAITRLYLVGSVAWPAFLLPDILPVFVTGDATNVGWLVALRALGECFGLPAYIVFRYAGTHLSPAAITVIDAIVFLLGSVFLAMMGIPFQGISSSFQQGVLIFILARYVLLPLDWHRAIVIPMGCLFAYPVTLMVAGWFLPEIRAQWSNRHDLAVFLHNFLFNAAAMGVGVLGSHLIYATKRELTETRKLGNYRLKLRIGGGGMGEVWLARQVSLERDVALKVMREQSSRSGEAIKRFEREARAASQLKHPNTIRIFDFGASDDGLLYIAMELLDGMDLDALVSTRGPLPAARVIYLARQACGSLAEAHARGILHRDIKPANLFVAKVGKNYDVLKLLDFGVARVTETGTDAKLTATGKLTGTPAYMSPEICGGDAKIDQRSDIYSLGAVLYYMATGTELFPTRTFGEVVMMHISRAPERPSTRVATLPADLERVIMKCLEKAPADRYASVDELERDLAACADARAWSNEEAQGWWRGAQLSEVMRVAG
jgi:hypothetical protein